MDLDLAGRSAVVTGGSRGIGLAIVRGLAAAGARVTVGARKSSADLDELARTGQVRVVLADLADPAAPASLIGQAGDRIDVLVNNVGGAPARTGGFLSITDADWRATIELDLMAAVRTTRAALPAMLAAGTGVIISTCSVNARLPDPAVMDYSVAKAGLASFCKALSKEVGPRGIRVNTVSPGPGRGTADVVDQHIDPVSGLPDQTGWARGVAQICQHDPHLAGSRELVEVSGGFPGPHGDPRTSRRQPADYGQADSLAPAGDDGTAPRQIQIHSMPSLPMPASLRGICASPSAESEPGRLAYRSAGPRRGRLPAVGPAR